MVPVPGGGSCPHAHCRSLPPEGAAPALGRPCGGGGCPHTHWRSLSSEGAALALGRPCGGGGRLLQCRRHALAKVVAQLCDPVGGGAALAEQLRGRAHPADRAGGADAIAEQGQFGIVAARVGIAVRPLQAHGELPDLARAHAGRRLGGAGACLPGIPAQRQPARHTGRGLSDVEDEAGRIRIEHGQAGHHAAYRQDLRLQRWG